MSFAQINFEESEMRSIPRTADELELQSRDKMMKHDRITNQMRKLNAELKDVTRKSAELEKELFHFQILEPIFDGIDVYYIHWTKSDFGLKWKGVSISKLSIDYVVKLYRFRTYNRICAEDGELAQDDVEELHSLSEEDIVNDVLCEIEKYMAKQSRIEMFYVDPKLIAPKFSDTDVIDIDYGDHDDPADITCGMTVSVYRLTKY